MILERADGTCPSSEKRWRSSPMVHLPGKRFSVR